MWWDVRQPAGLPLKITKDLMKFKRLFVLIMTFISVEAFAELKLFLRLFSFYRNQERKTCPHGSHCFPEKLMMAYLRPDLNQGLIFLNFRFPGNYDRLVGLFLYIILGGSFLNELTPSLTFSRLKEVTRSSREISRFHFGNSAFKILPSFITWFESVRPGNLALVIITSSTLAVRLTLSVTMVAR